MTETQLKQNAVSVFSCLSGLYWHLSKKRCWQLFGLLILMLVGAFAELATLGAVMPFLAILADPAKAAQYSWLQAVLAFFSVSEAQGILLPATLVFASASLIAAGIRMLLAWVSYQFSFGVGVDLATEIFRRSLYQPLSFHVRKNSSEIIAGLVKVNTVVWGVLTPLTTALIALVLGSAILATLLYIDGTTASIAGAGFTFIYLVVMLTTRRRLQVNSKVINEREASRIKVMQESLGGIRDVILDDSHEVFIRRFFQFDQEQASARASNNFVSFAPRFLVEALGIILIAFLAYWLSLKDGGVSGVLPILGALAIGAQKLLPQIQQIYQGWSSISGNRNTLVDVLGMLNLEIPNNYLMTKGGGPTLFLSDIHLKSLSYSYGEDLPEVLRNIDIKIPKGGRVGFMGKTGSGKSTLVDLVMGLLEPSDGSIEIDGIGLDSSNRRAWQSIIAHVPQSVYLSDATLAENIAFGQSHGEIDYDRLRRAAERANIMDFVDTLPQSFNAVVGERGVRLSGGQRQRIGLARAFYKKAKVMVLDEATSALDNKTEQEVMKAVDDLDSDLTVIIIAHRLSTLKGCDVIYELSHGAIVRSGNYSDMTSGS